jgi:hypothetical protein
VLPYEQNVEVRYNGNDAPVLPTWQHQVSGLVSQCVPAGHHSFQCGVLHFMGLSVILKVGMQFGVFLSSFSSLGFVVFTVDIQFSSFSRALKRKIRRFLRRRRAVGGCCGEGRDEHQWSKHLRKSIGRR